LLIEGASHSSYNDAKTKRNGRRKKQSGDTNLIHTLNETTTLAFWDAYLKGDNLARQYLISKSPQTYSNGMATLFTK